MNSTRIVTHSGGYHADDVFAVATLALALEQDGAEYEVIRSRDDEVIASGDVVVDVGGEFDSARQRFDHHMKGGAGARENNIPYAAFGLVWQAYGERLASDPEVRARFDTKIVQPIDAIDNGVNITESLHEDIGPYTIHAVLGAFQPAWNEAGDIDAAFARAVALAKELITRELVHISANLTAETLIKNAYEAATDKRVIILEDTIERAVIVGTLTQFSEPLIAVYPHKGGDWHVVTCRDRMDSFEARLDFPAEWGGLTGKELESASNITGATFCHPKLFLCGATNKKAAIAIATAALEAASF